MKKTKRILALTGALLLICMYLCTLVAALVNSSWANDLLKASVAGTILIPVLLYSFILIARLLSSNSEEEHEYNESDIQ